MAKYINIEKVKAEIERLSSSEHPIEYEWVEKLAYNRALSEIEDVINSLNQEQPIEKDLLTWQDINELERIINNVHYEFRSGINEELFGKLVLERFNEGKDAPLQPVVNLEKELQKLDNAYFDLDGIAIAGTSYYLKVEDLKYIARHFYELGLNAGKENKE